jgi:hypothetical protein
MTQILEIEISNKLILLNCSYSLGAKLFFFIEHLLISSALTSNQKHISKRKINIKSFILVSFCKKNIKFSLNVS